MNSAPQSLMKHYNNKYSQSSYTQVRSYTVVNYPSTRFEMAVKILNNIKGGNYLEIGAGDGAIALTVFNNFESLTLIEISEHRKEELTKLFNSKRNVRIINTNLDYERLPYPDETFDVVVMIAVIEHLIDPIRACQEIFRVLKHDGILIIDTPNIAKITRRIKLLFGYFPSTASINEGLLMYDKRNKTDLFDEGHLHYFTFRSLEKMLKERCGFNKFERFGYGNFKTMKIPYVFAKIYPSLFSEIFLVAKK